MAFTCLPVEKAKEFRETLKSRDITIEDLLSMSTEERTAILEKYVGDEAKTVNTLFEEKLLLKNRIQGIKNWASKVGQIGKYDPVIKAELENMASEYKARQQERIFNPKEEETFLNDAADASMGTHITREEAKNVFDLTKKTEELKGKFNGKEWSSPEARQSYGVSKVAMENYVQALKEGDTSLGGMLRDAKNEFKADFAENKPRAVLGLLGKAMKTISENSIALVASLDNSFLGRQGIHALFTHPTVWWDGAIHSFTDFGKTIGGREMMDALMADVYSNPNYINGSYDIAKILPKSEEQFPTSLPERIWGLGRVFKASEVAFKGSAIRMRTGLYDLVSDIADRNGVDMTDKYQIESVGRLVNSLTARGQFGKVGESPIVKMVLWAPRMLKANFDVLTAHTGQDISPFARKQAAVNLVKVVATTAGIMTIANAIKPGSAELDPRSANFGKIKVGNTTFDFTGGAGSLITLASRLVPIAWGKGATKSTTTGIVTPLNAGDFGSRTGFDVLIDFLAGKTTPPVRVLIDLLQGADATGKKITVAGELTNAGVPITAQNLLQLKDDHSASAMSGLLLDALGVNSQTNVPQPADWSDTTSLELLQFKAKVGDDRFKKANADYVNYLQKRTDQVKQKPAFQKLSPEDKQKAMTKLQDEAKSWVFTRYNFNYKPQKSKPLPKL